MCVGANTMQVMSLVSIPSILGAHTLEHMRTMIVPLSGQQTIHLQCIYNKYIETCNTEIRDIFSHLGFNPNQLDGNPKEQIEANQRYMVLNKYLYNNHLYIYIP